MSTVTGESAAFTALESIVRGWRDSGEPGQAAIPWPKDRWIVHFPEHADLFIALPDLIDRTAVHRVFSSVGESEAFATRAFLVSMVWGYGKVGYGPWRARRVLEQPGAAAKLLEVAQIVRADGGLAGYAALAREHRIRWLGPAFGTKFLYFCPQSDNGQRSLILDRIVADWLNQHLRPGFNPVPWAPRTYRRYLGLMEDWAAGLAVCPEVLEERLFVANATGQWSARSPAGACAVGSGTPPASVR